jgi:hypothetical protein
MFDENHSDIIIPVIRRVYPQLLAEDIIGVQPMTVFESGYVYTPYIPLLLTKTEIEDTFVPTKYELPDDLFIIE